MHRRFGRLRVMKWIGTAGCVLVVAVFVTSGWLAAGVGDRWRSVAASIWIEGGLTGIVVQSFTEREEFGWFHFYYPESHRVGPGPCEGNAKVHMFEDPPGPSFCWPQVPSVAGDEFEFGVAAVIPLWTWLVAFLVPTVLTWRFDRYRARPGHCRKCAYDLTGNTSGRCPECGTPVGSRGAE